MVKPDIVFFGENLPARFFSCMQSDFLKVDLLIVMGTSLKVQPFASLISKAPLSTPRLLINKEKTGQTDPFLGMMMGLGGGMDFDSKRRTGTWPGWVTATRAAWPSLISSDGRRSWRTLSGKSMPA